jgi:hypothetical protein
LHVALLTQLLQIESEYLSGAENRLIAENKKTPSPPGCKYGEGSTLLT